MFLYYPFFRGVQNRNSLIHIYFQLTAAMCFRQSLWGCSHPSKKKLVCLHLSMKGAPPPVTPCGHKPLSVFGQIGQIPGAGRSAGADFASLKAKRARAPAHPPHRLPQNALPSSIRHSPASIGESPSARGEKGWFCPWRQEKQVAGGKLRQFCPWEAAAGHKMGLRCAR